jgi:hypothetical protein
MFKRSRELKRQRKAAEKRERRLARKQAKNNPEGLEEDENGEFQEDADPEALPENGAPPE